MTITNLTQRAMVAVIVASAGNLTVPHASDAVGKSPDRP